jgi:hypothetical protein
VSVPPALKINRSSNTGCGTLPNWIVITRLLQIS